MSNIFEKAAAVLMGGGHCKGTLTSGPAHCAMGALIDVSDDATNEAYEAADRAAKRLELKFPGSVKETGSILHPLARWNDAPERTGEDVILLFKELAAEEE